MAVLKKNTVLAMGRMFGSGGRAIGKRVAEMLGAAYYDGEILEAVAKKSGMSSEFVETFDEKLMNSFMYSLAMGSTVTNLAGISVSEQVYKAQVDTIKELAAKSPCVIVGRRADKLLEKDFDVVSVFVSAPTDYRVQHVVDREGVSEHAAAKRIKKADKERASYYNFYCEDSWGRANNYNLCIDSSKLTTEQAAQLIVDYLQVRGKVE